MKKIIILGAGTWGATLAQHLAQKKFDVTLWEFDKLRAKILNKTRTLATLPDLKLSSSVKIVDDMANALLPHPPEIIVAATPSFAFSTTMIQLNKILLSLNLRPKFSPDIVIATKGFAGLKPSLPSDEAARIFPLSRIAVLTGPSHAEEVAQKMPTAITVASKDIGYAQYIQKIFSTEYLRVYTNLDIIGAGLSGALKNIYGIAAGISDGLCLGDNTKAALVTRSLAEMSRVGKLLGGKPETFLGLSGMGDLIVTCYSRHSRNRNLGEMLGRGLNLKQALRRMTMVAEGVYATKSLSIIKKHNRRLFDDCPTPVADEVYAILFLNKPRDKSITTLMTRPLKSE